MDGLGTCVSIRGLTAELNKTRSTIQSNSILSHLGQSVELLFFTRDFFLIKTSHFLCSKQNNVCLHLDQSIKPGSVYQTRMFLVQFSARAGLSNVVFLEVVSYLSNTKVKKRNPYIYVPEQSIFEAVALRQQIALCTVWCLQMLRLEFNCDARGRARRLWTKQ